MSAKEPQRKPASNADKGHGEMEIAPTIGEKALIALMGADAAVNVGGEINWNAGIASLVHEVVTHSSPLDTPEANERFLAEHAQHVRELGHVLWCAVTTGDFAIVKLIERVRKRMEAPEARTLWLLCRVQWLIEQEFCAEDWPDIAKSCRWEERQWLHEVHEHGFTETSALNIIENSLERPWPSRRTVSGWLRIIRAQGKIDRCQE